LLADRVMIQVSQRTPLAVRLYRTARICLHLLEGVVTTSLIFPLLRPRTQRSVVGIWSRRLLRMLNVDARVHGSLVITQGNVLLVANHVSWLDIFVLSSVHPVRFIAKAELARLPIIGRMVRSVGTLFVERARRRDTRRVNHRAADALSRGDIVAVFPEGTTSDGTDVLPFKSSLLQPIVDANGHVQPVAIRYRASSGEFSVLPAYVGNLTLLASLWRITAARSLIVDVHAPPMLAAQAAHRRELARAAEAAIRAALREPVAATAPGIPAGRETGSP
jgi:1-acyl-sn-glycerol-3-phosphate acyltransferase